MLICAPSILLSIPLLIRSLFKYNIFVLFVFILNISIIDTVDEIKRL